MARTSLFPIALLFVSIHVARSQRPAARPYAVEIRAHERWLQGRQQSRFTPFHSSDRWVFVDSVRPEGDARRWFVSVDRRGGDRHASILVRQGAVASIDADGPRRPRVALFGEDSTDFMRFQLFQDGNGALQLPATKVWDLVPSFHPGALASGAQWTDTISLTSAVLGNRQALSGRRVSSLVRDTVIGGRRLWIVSDRATVHYDEIAMREERTLDTFVPHVRVAHGAMQGWMVYDPTVGLFRDRVDTTLLTGETELRYADGRAFQVPTRYERTRRWIVYDSADYALRERQIRADFERKYSGGVVIVPTDPTDERLSKGDTLLRDSLVRVWQASTDPDLRAQLYSRLTLWGRHDTSFVHRLEEMRIAEGDSAAWLEMLARREYTQRWRSPPIDSATMRQLIRVMADPGYPFAFGVQRDGFYEDLAQALLTAPPAVTRDTARWPCTPDACRLLAAQWHDATEQRLRDVGLVAAFALDPLGWGDTLLAVAGSTKSPLLAHGSLLARGVAGTSAGSSKTPIPEANANWRAWTEWMSGVNPAFQRWRDSTIPVAMRGPAPLLGFGDSHRIALRVAELRTGRNISGELRHAWTHAGTDSASVVYEYMLFRLGDYRPPPDSIATHFRSSSRVRHELAIQELESILTDSSALADSATTVRLENDLISMTLADGHPWRTLDAPPNGRAPQPMRESALETTYLLTDSVPAAVRAQWAERIRTITAAEWKARSERTGGTLFTLTSVRRVGPFARLGLESSGRLARRGDQAPWLYYGGTTYYLMQLGNEWVIVGTSGWVT